MLANIIYFVFFMFGVNVCVAKNYMNYTLYRAIPLNESQIEFLSKLKDSYDVNYWREPGAIHKAIEFVINPLNQQDFIRDAEKYNIYFTTIIEDVQKAFDQQTVKSYIRTDKGTFNWYNYFRLDDIYDWLRDLERLYPEEMKLQSIGKSHENRDIMAVSIILKDCKSPRSKVVIEGGIHAREWISPAFVTYLISGILNANSSKNNLLKEVANSYEWYFVPVLNVDGYEYTHTQDRLWRKNRHGDGVDLNRNFDYEFGTIGVSSDRKTDIYCGKKAFSEKETQAMANFVRSKSEDLKYYMAFHAYGQYMIIPYANSKEHSENFDEVYGMCKQASNKIKSMYGTKYAIGTAFDTVGYGTSGVAACWVKKQLKVPYVVTFELRDTGHYGFALPISKILPTCKETMAGVLELLRSKNDVQHKTLTALSHPVKGGAFNVSGQIIQLLFGFLFIMVFI